MKAIMEGAGIEARRDAFNRSLRGLERRGLVYRTHHRTGHFQRWEATDDDDDAIACDT
jgi:hypothetical protein